MPRLPKCKDSKMCDCAVEVDNRNKKDKKVSHGAQTDGSSGLDFCAFFSNLGSMFDGVGPWLPYIGGSALLMMLFGFLSKNMDKMLGIFESDSFQSKKPAIVRQPDPQDDSCSAKCSMRIDTNRIRWPNR